MSLLESNARKVRSLSAAGIWLFIIGRVLVALGIGILAMSYYPKLALPAAWPLVGVGAALVLFAFVGYSRK